MVGGADNDYNDAQTWVESFIPGASCWVTEPAMSTARKGPGAAQYGTSLYVAGGYGLSSVEAFTGSAWEIKASMSTVRQYFCLVSYGTMLYALGGEGSNGYLDVQSSVEAFNGADWSATSGFTLQTARSHFGCAVFNNRLYTVGGRSGEGSGLSSVEVYDGTTNTLAPSMGTARYNHGVAAFNDRLYAVGGSGTTAETTVEFFDGSTWSSQSSAIDAWMYGGIVSLGASLYLIAGSPSGGRTDAVRRGYIASAGATDITFTAAATLNLGARAAPGAASFDPSVSVGASASITGDPHVHGAHGDSFDFKGEHGGIYVLLSTARLSLSARFVHEGFTTPYSKLHVRGSWIRSVPPLPNATST